MDEDVDDGDDDGVAQRFRCDAHPGRMWIPSAAAPVRRRDRTPLSPPSSSSLPPPSARHRPRRRHYSFLQHFAADDVLLRIFEFVDCSSLVRTGATCHRFRELSARSAEQRTHRLHADGRLLRNAMRMLRAQEQIEGVGPREGSFGPFVPIPMLGLPRRVRVSGAGDPEYDGVYFCTGCNGNGFLFTKPRWPRRGVAAAATTTTTTVAGVGGRNRGGGAWWMNNNDNDNARPAWGVDGEGWMEEVPFGGGGIGAAAAAVVAGGAAHRRRDAEDRRRDRRDADDRRRGRNRRDEEDDEANSDGDEVEGDGDGDEGDGDEGDGDRALDINGGGRRHDVADVLTAGNEGNRQSRPLRCVIAKRFSNETILWYMSKEVENELTCEVTQSFSFWAKLLVTGDASPDVCQYPSQTSILSRNSEPAWQNLTSTLDFAPPNVELLDG
jgi:hypothetical protein